VPRMNRVEIYDAHGARSECTPTFFERFEEAFLIEAQAFVAAARARLNGAAADAGQGASLEDALEATRIGYALRQSLQTGQAVTL
jgi:myo-inositol 2-dehydrogenase / D-chiro-inositol 1-dehydrogenase